MEAIGLVASLVNIIQGIELVGKYAKENIHSSKSASAELGLLLGKLSALQGLLQGIRTQATLDSGNERRLSALNQVGGPLENVQDAISKILLRLEKFSKHNVVFGKVIDKDIARCMASLDNAIPILQLALDADQR